jgi:hypothetical protein
VTPAAAAAPAATATRTRRDDRANGSPPELLAIKVDGWAELSTLAARFVSLYTRRPAQHMSLFLRAPALRCARTQARCVRFCSALLNKQQTTTTTALHNRAISLLMCLVLVWRARRDEEIKKRRS